ncbi:alpha/beta hydrolase [Rhizobium ruizarguesonis]|nr:alpha/beta hydrolase [Rhizobium ruizarguesonis]
MHIDMFRRQVTEMGPKRPHFVILTSTRDKALEMSNPSSARSR